LKHLFYILFFISIANIGFSQKTIEILNANSLESSPAFGKDTYRYIGNVVFKHNDVLMYCDSAHFNTKTNIIIAYSNIHIIQSDTFHIYSDFLNYYGDLKKAELRQNVKLVDDDMVLKTNFLDYFLTEKKAVYFNGGEIIDSQNKLVSNEAYYYTETDLLQFKKKVSLTNKKYNLTSDTLHYNTRTNIAYFVGPTNIISDSSSIYCERGSYNTNNDVSNYSKNAKVINKEQTIVADSLYYDKIKGIGKGFKNVTITDTINKTIIKCNHIIFYDKEKRSIANDSLVLIFITDEDSLYLHGDTLRTYTDTIKEKRTMCVYNNVKLFKVNLQGKCDSLIYSETDSTFKLYDEPILWSDENQITGKFIQIHKNADKIDYMDIFEESFIISQVDKKRFNQINGDTLYAYFRENELYRIKVNNNGKAIYYAKDDKELYVGVNIAKCKNMLIFVENRNIKSITFLDKPEATFNPLDQVSQSDLILDGFLWHNEIRPKNKNDIFKD